MAKNPDPVPESAKRTLRGLRARRREAADATKAFPHPKSRVDEAPYDPEEAKLAVNKRRPRRA